MLSIGLQYIAFLSLMGQEADLKEVPEKYGHLFSETLAYIKNGASLSSTCPDFIGAMYEMHKAFHSYTIEQKHASYDEKSHTVTLCYTLMAHNRPAVITTAILTLTDEGKISEILEVSASAQKTPSLDILEKVSDLDLVHSTKDDQEELDCRLGDFNLRQVPATQTEVEVDLSLCLKKDGHIVAGINACMYAWYITYVHILYVDEGYRGQDLATYLLKKVEENAKAKGSNLIHLDTFSFQARDFYLKQGYQIFGTLDDCPKGHKRYYLKKIL